ncbi:MAG: helix-turn-helix transcriptional regulator [Phascolarctobacterium sp.]|nr:helix-turn-helix transcriptional regulator [Phascolarctobacterium sp.]
MKTENYIIERIEALREERQMSRYRLAQVSGLSQSSVSNLLNRSNVPTIHTLEKICVGLGVTLAQFFAKDGKTLDLTEDQEKILSVWGSLSEEERLRVYAFMQGMRKD